MKSSALPIVIIGIIPVVLIMIGFIYISPLTNPASEVNTIERCEEECWTPEQLDEAKRIHSIGDTVGTGRSFVKMEFESSGIPLIFQEDEPTLIQLTKPLSSALPIVNPDFQSLESIKYYINYDLENFKILESTADMEVVACPVVFGQASCYDIETQISFDEAVPFVIVNQEQLETVKEHFAGGSFIEFIFITNTATLKVISEIDGQLYEITVSDLQASVKLPNTVIEEIEVEITGNTDVGVTTTPTDDEPEDVGEIVILGNGVEGIVEEIEVCTGITNPPQGGQCTAGMCKVTYSNDNSGTIRECRD